MVGVVMQRESIADPFAFEPLSAVWDEQTPPVRVEARTADQRLSDGSIHALGSARSDQKSSGEAAERAGAVAEPNSTST